VRYVDIKRASGILQKANCKFYVL